MPTAVEGADERRKTDHQHGHAEEENNRVQHRFGLACEALARGEPAFGLVVAPQDVCANGRQGREYGGREPEQTAQEEESLFGCGSSAEEDTPAKPTVPKTAQRLETRRAAQDAEIARLRKEIEYLRREKDRLANLVKIAAAEDPSPILTPRPIEATVQKVDRKQRYVMLSVGTDAKVAKGYRFLISRNGRFIGDVQVDHVYPKVSAASFVRIAPGEAFKVGDRQANTRP